jgi:hypothetical protein
MLPALTPLVSPANNCVVASQLLHTYLVTFRPHARIPWRQDTLKRAFLGDVARFPQPVRQVRERAPELTDPARLPGGRPFTLNDLHRIRRSELLVAPGVFACANRTPLQWRWPRLRSPPSRPP